MSACFKSIFSTIEINERILLITKLFFDKIDFLPQREIICFNHLGRGKNPANETDPYLKDIVDNCYTIQLLGAGSSTNDVNNFPYTIVGQIYKKFKVL